MVLVAVPGMVLIQEIGMVDMLRIVLVGIAGWVMIILGVVMIGKQVSSLMRLNKATMQITGL